MIIEANYNRNYVFSATPSYNNRATLQQSHMRIQTLLNNVEQKSQNRKWVISCATFFIIPCALYLYVSSLSPSFLTLWPLDMYFGFTCEKAYDILHKYGPHGRTIFKWCEIIELCFYIPSYVTCLSIASCALFRTVNLPKRCYIILIFAGMWDMIETSGLLFLVTTYSSNPAQQTCTFLHLLSYINMIKWCVGGTWITLVLISLTKLALTR